MKPKNLILIAVAVVCGLVAAFLTARLTAGQSKPPVDMVDVPVAARNIPMGTKIPPKDVEQFFVLKKFPRENVPPTALQTLEEFHDKRTMRPIKEGQLVDSSDVNAKGFIDPPAGMMLMSTPISLDAAASGFAIPGYHVCVIATKKSQKKNMEIVFPLFLDVLVLAVNTDPSAPQVQGAGKSGGEGGNANKGGGEAAGFQQVSMISFAVTPQQSILLTMAANGGANLRLGLPPQDEEKKQVVIDGYKQHAVSFEEVCNIFADRWPEDEKKEAGVAKAKVRVPAETIAAGTQLTDEVLERKFKEVEYPKELLPDGVATADRDFADKFAAADLVPGLLVPKPHLSKDKPKPNEVIKEVVREVKVYEEMKLPPKAAPDLSVASPKGVADTTKLDPKPKEYVYVTITTPHGRRVQKYEVTAKGHLYVGDEPAEGTQPAAEKRVD